jgi:hypothetical protein
MDLKITRNFFPAVKLVVAVIGHSDGRKNDQCGIESNHHECAEVKQKPCLECRAAGVVKSCSPSTLHGS